MPTKHLFQLLITLLFAHSAFAGGTDPTVNVEPPPPLYRQGLLNGQLGFHLAPSALLGTFRGVRFGGQIRVGRLILGGDVLLSNKGMANLLIRNEELLEYNANGFYPEVKYIIAEEGYTELLYVSAVVPIHQREILINQGTFTDFSQNKRYDVLGARQKHQKVSVGLKLGAVKALGEKLYWEYYAGFGLGRRSTKYSSIANRTLADEQPGSGVNLSGDLLSERECLQIDLLLGLRLGFRL